MSTDTSERSLERLICTALTGHPCDPPAAGAVAEPSVSYGGAGWSCGNPHDYDREHCVDRVQLAAFLRATQPEVAEAVGMASTGVGATHASPLRGGRGRCSGLLASGQGHRKQCPSRVELLHGGRGDACVAPT